MQSHARGTRHRHAVLGIGEVVGLGLQVQLEAVPGLAHETHADLRCALVRRFDAAGRIGVLQHLPALPARIRGPVAEAAHELHVRAQQARRDALDLAREVLPVRIVRDPQHARRQGRGIADLAVLREVERIARTLREPVVGQQVQVELAVVARQQVAHFAGQARSAARAPRGRERRIQVRRDIPVVRHRKLQAALAVQVDARRQPARLARIGERKAERRRREDRHAQEAQYRTLGNALVGLEIESHLACRQHPGGSGFAVGSTAGVGRIGGRRAIGAEEVDALCRAAARGAREVVGRLEKVAFVALDLHLQRVADVAVAALVDTHVAGGAGGLAGRVVAQAIGADAQRAAAEFGHPFGHRLGVGTTTQGLRFQKDRQRRSGLAARWWREARRDAQDDAGRGVGGSRLCAGRAERGQSGDARDQPARKRRHGRRGRSGVQQRGQRQGSCAKRRDGVGASEREARRRRRQQ